MATKKSVWFLFAILVISVWVLGSTIQVGAETMKCRSSGTVVTFGVMPIPDVEGHTISIINRDGSVSFEGGEVAHFKAFATSDTIMGRSGVAKGYLLFSFADGSSIITSFSQSNEPDPEGKFAWNSKFTGEILKGTKRFEGIKGNLSGDGKQFKPEKGEPVGKSSNDWTFTYALPTK